MKNPFALFGNQWIAKTVTLAVIVAGGATVAVSNLPEPADHTVAHLPAKDVASWAMPFDRYVNVSSAKRDYAEDLLIGACLSSEGVAWNVPWQDVDGYRADALAQTPEPLSSALAAERAYHAPTVDPLSSYLWHRFVEQKPLSRAHQVLADTCLRDVRTTQLSTAAVSGMNQNASTLAVELAHRAYGAATRDSEVARRAAAWKTCLTPAAKVAGLDPLPSSPSEMPSTGVRQEFETEVTSGRVTADEKALATADAACQESSGYRTTLYAVEYRLQSRVTAADARVLAAATADQPAFDRKLDRIIAAHLPAKPAS